MVELASIVDGRVWDPARRAVEKRMGLMAAADGLDGGYLALAYVGSDGTYFTVVHGKEHTAPSRPV